MNCSWLPRQPFLHSAHRHYKQKSIIPATRRGFQIFSYGFPMISYGFPTFNAFFNDFLWLSIVFHRLFITFNMPPSRAAPRSPRRQAEQLHTGAGQAPNAPGGHPTTPKTPEKPSKTHKKKNIKETDKNPIKPMENEFTELEHSSKAF